jgi:hypothetical protein
VIAVAITTLLLFVNVISAPVSGLFKGSVTLPEIEAGRVERAVGSGVGAGVDGGVGRGAWGGVGGEMAGATEVVVGGGVGEGVVGADGGAVAGAVVESVRSLSTKPTAFASPGGRVTFTLLGPKSIYPSGFVSVTV